MRAKFWHKLFGTHSIVEDKGNDYPVRYCYSCGRPLVICTTNKGFDEHTGKLVSYWKVWRCSDDNCAAGIQERHSMLFVL
jgi:hypothetical protein